MTAIDELAEIRVHAGSRSEFESDFSEVIQALREAPGCLDAQHLRSVDVPNTYVLSVHWTRLEDHTVAFQPSAAGEQVKQVLIRYCVAPPRVIHVEGVRHQ